MPNPTITNVDLGTVQVRDCEFYTELLTLAGADELKEGTILARDSVSGKLVLFAKGGNSNGNGIPKAVLSHPVSSSTSGSHDVVVRAIQKGVLNLRRLVIDADGDNSNIDGAVRDQLRAYGLTPVNVEDLGRVDNPQPEVGGS
jgi:hypothetical protein